jgi:RNA polymerase sigma-70 factor (ECF subfamily)
VDETGTSSLLERAAEGEPGAWDRLVSLYEPLVRHWCLRGGVPPDQVADVAQEVFQAVATRLPYYRPGGGPFRAWVRGIARHKILDWFRSRAQHPCAVGGSDALHQLQQVEAPNVELAEDDTERTALMRHGLDLVRGEFEDRTWQAFWRTAVDGLAAPDVAAELAMSPGAVRVAKSRVLHRLRQEFRDMLG